MTEQPPFMPLAARIDAVRNPLWASTAHLSEILEQLRLMQDGPKLPPIWETVECNPVHGYIAETLLYAAATAHEVDAGIYDILIEYLQTLAARTTIN